MLHIYLLWQVKILAWMGSLLLLVVVWVMLGEAASRPSSRVYLVTAHGKTYVVKVAANAGTYTAGTQRCNLLNVI